MTSRFPHLSVSDRSRLPLVLSSAGLIFSAIGLDGRIWLSAAQSPWHSLAPYTLVPVDHPTPDLDLLRNKRHASLAGLLAGMGPQRKRRRTMQGEEKKGEEADQEAEEEPDLPQPTQPPQPP